MEDDKNEDSESLIKREVNSPDPNDTETKEDSKENQDANENKNKIFNHDRSKCSKCLVSLFVTQNRFVRTESVHSKVNFK